MTSVIIAAPPISGETAPMLQIAAGLAGRGHRVTSVGGSRFASAAGAAGAVFVPLSGAADDDDRRIDFGPAPVEPGASARTANLAADAALQEALRPSREHTELLVRALGATQQALAAGVPVVIAGATEDEPPVAARVAQHGLGVDLGTSTPTPAQIADAVAAPRATTRSGAGSSGSPCTEAGSWVRRQGPDRLHLHQGAAGAAPRGRRVHRRRRSAPDDHHHARQPHR